MTTAITGGCDRIGRQTEQLSLALTASLNTTPLVDFSAAAGGTIFVPAASPITTLTYYAAPDNGGTFLPLNDAAGVAVTQTVAAGKAYDMPAACFGAAALKIVVNSAGAVLVSLKG
jgi:hypothetical protein